MVAGPGLGITLHTDICLPYFLDLTDDEQKGRWLPGFVSGELVTAIAMTEPGTGSDLAAIEHHRTGATVTATSSTARRRSSPTASTPTWSSWRSRPTRPSDTAGCACSWSSAGWRASSAVATSRRSGRTPQDTAELFFDDVRVPAANRLGEEGEGFRHLVQNLPQERLSIAGYGVAAARAAPDMDPGYVQQRTAFGLPVGSFQNTRFRLAELATEVEIAQAFVDQCTLALGDGELTRRRAQGQVLVHRTAGPRRGPRRPVARRLRLHGRVPDRRAWADARITRIYGGTTEIMKEIVSRDLGLREQ